MKDIDVDESEVYFRLEPFESAEIKRDILESVAGILRMQINSEKYFEIRKEIRKTRIGAEKNMVELKRNINEIMEKLPAKKTVEQLEIKAEKKEEKHGMDAKNEVKAIKEEKTKKRKKEEYSLNNELEEIQRRLEQLG